MTGGADELTVVVVAYAMGRELPRTLQSLLPPSQLALPSPYEIVVVDNGSPEPVVLPAPAPPGVDLRLVRVDDADASPARAANLGIERARASVVGLIVDGARMASPRLLSTALLATGVHPRAVVTAPAWHLGPTTHMRARSEGYDQRQEDQMLDAVNWTNDGYSLFGIATPAASSHRGLFGPMGESSSLFLRRELWDELGGLDERFALPGGGMVNHDLYRRACELDDSQLVVVLGEGTFHQIHGGAATSGRITTEEMRRDYEAITGRPHRPPPNQPVYIGSVPPQYLSYLRASVALAQARECPDD